MYSEERWSNRQDVEAGNLQRDKKKDLEKGRDSDTMGGFIAVCVCLFMMVLLYFALSYPANRYYHVHYPEHPPPMYTLPQNYPYFYGSR